MNLAKLSLLYLLHGKHASAAVVRASFIYIKREQLKGLILRFRAKNTSGSGET